jgi:hypothetical protein
VTNRASDKKARQVKAFQVQITKITAQVMKNRPVATFPRQVGRDAHASAKTPRTCTESTTRAKVLWHLSENGVKLGHYDTGTVQVRGKHVRDVANAASERLESASKTPSMALAKITDARAAKNTANDKMTRHMPRLRFK